MFAPLFLRRMFWICVALVVLAVAGEAQINFTGPQPGDVYREFAIRMTDNDHNWRVSDPNLGNWFPYNAQFDLPNAILTVPDVDLQGALRAEAVISMWGGHVGTTGKAIQFNGRNWITIPELGTQNGIPAGHEGEYYQNQPTVTLPIPLDQLVQGTNHFQGTNTGQAPKYSFNWGAFGWYNIIIRVYYDPASKAHPTGYISSPNSGGSFGENPTITTTITGGSVNRVDVIGSYYGYDTDGDGISTGYHYDYQAPTYYYPTVDIHNHVGTATGSPWQVTWSTDWVPDQSAGGVKLLARIRDNSGVWYCSPEVANLSLVRNGTSVQMFQSTPPERCWAQGDVGEQNLPVDVPSIQGATAAVYMVRSWNMPDILQMHNQADFPDWRRLNSWTDDERYGNDHYYSFDVRDVPLNALVQGTNTFHFYAKVSDEHGIEILWPGPALFIRYNGTPSNNPPSITQHPTDQTAAEGQTATFTVAAQGSGTLGYQWQKNQSDIGGATNSSYTTPTLSVADSGSHYRCVVKNLYGEATSNEALLSVTHLTAPKVTVQPAPQTVADGQPAAFSVTATGTTPLTYQWQKNAANISGANGATCNIAGAALADSGALFRCIVSNSKGADTSSSALLIVTPVAPTITTQPSGAQVGPGDTATFTVVAAGSLPRYYEWEKNGTPIPGATSTSYSFVAEKADSGAAFRCKVTNSGGSVTSDAARLIVGSYPPTITQHPVQVFVRLGETATFSVTATGTKTLTYQWQRDSVNISDATSPSYTTPPVVLDDNGRSYRCVVTNNYGTAISEAAVLTVTSDVNNLIANGDFESGTAPWNFYTNGSGSFGNDSTGPSSAHAARITIASVGDNVQLSLANVTLQADTAYTLMFKAYSNTGHDVDVLIHKDVSPYTMYSQMTPTFDLTTSWKDFRRDFTATGFSGTVSDARLRFWLTPYVASGDRYFVDDIILVKTSSLVAPSVTKHPLAKTVNEGETATFSVVVSGTTPFTYQWEKNQTVIPGATSASYTTPPLTTADNGAQYRCVVTNLVSSVVSDPATVTVITTGVKPKPEQPTTYYLAQNHPNPFNPSTIIEFGLPAAGRVTLRVSNLLGQEVRTLVDDFMGAGTHYVTFHAEGLPSGIYLYRMQSGKFVATKKLVLVK